MEKQFKNEEIDSWSTLSEQQQHSHIIQIRENLLAWYAHSERIVPWRELPTPYRVWLGEVMGQQTRMTALIPYYERFLQRFPDVNILASSSLDEVLKAWEGLGYYSRARNLHKAARILAQKPDWPQDIEEWRALPGVGPYTAAAIVSIAFGQRYAALDGNAQRVLSRLFALETAIDRPEAKKKQEAQLLALLPQQKPGDGNQAVMELGALICLPKTPRCENCPLTSLCIAHTLSMQTVLPIKKNKIVAQQQYRAIALVQNEEGAFLMHRRKESGLLGGLWEFPGVDLASNDENVAEKHLTRLLNDNQIFVKAWKKGTRAKHVFTHKIWDMCSYWAEAKKATLLDGWLWKQAFDLDDLAMPTAMSAYKEIAMQSVQEAE